MTGDVFSSSFGMLQISTSPHVVQLPPQLDTHFNEMIPKTSHLWKRNIIFKIAILRGDLLVV